MARPGRRRGGRAARRAADDLINAGVARWQVMDDGDAVAHVFLVEALADARPDDAFLSEEGRDTPSRLARDRVWIVDPLDGTNEYGERTTEWAVHIALVIDGSAVAAAVALPVHGRPSPPIPPVAGADRDGTPRMVTSRGTRLAPPQ